MAEGSPGRDDLNKLLQCDKTPRRVWSLKKNRRALDDEFADCDIDEKDMGSTSTEAKVTEMEKYMREMQRQISELTLQRDQLQMEVQSLNKNTGRVGSETGDSRDKKKVNPWSDWAGQTWTSRSSKEAWHAEQSEEHWQHKENNDTQRSNWWKEERRKRTLTIGGFLRGSRRGDVVTAAKEIFKDVWGVEDNGIYSLFKRTSVAFVRFQTGSEKGNFLKSFRGQERPSYYGRPLWDARQSVKPLRYLLTRWACQITVTGLRQTTKQVQCGSMDAGCRVGAAGTKK